MHSALHEIMHARHPAPELTHRNKHSGGLAVIMGLSDLVFTSLSALWWPCWGAAKCPKNRKTPNGRETQGLSLPETEFISAQIKMIVSPLMMMCGLLPYSPSPFSKWGPYGQGATPPLPRSDSVWSNEGNLLVNLPYSHFSLMWKQWSLHCLLHKKNKNTTKVWLSLIRTLLRCVMGKCIFSVSAIKWVVK